MTDPETNIPTPEPVAPEASQGGALGTITAVIRDATAAEVIATGALALIMKLKSVLTHNHADISVEIQNLDADALTAYQTELDEANAWLKARGYPTVG